MNVYDFLTELSTGPLGAPVPPEMTRDDWQHSWEVVRAAESRPRCPKVSTDTKCSPHRHTKPPGCARDSPRRPALPNKPLSKKIVHVIIFKKYVSIQICIFMMIPIIQEQCHFSVTDRYFENLIIFENLENFVFFEKKIRSQNFDFVSDAISRILRLFSIGWMRWKGNGKCWPKNIQERATSERRAL